jgi:hypothetical protein
LSVMRRPAWGQACASAPAAARTGHLMVSLRLRRVRRGIHKNARGRLGKAKPALAQSLILLCGLVSDLPSAQPPPSDAWLLMSRIGCALVSVRCKGMPVSGRQAFRFAVPASHLPPCACTGLWWRLWDRRRPVRVVLRGRSSSVHATHGSPCPKLARHSGVHKQVPAMNAIGRSISTSRASVSCNTRTSLARSCSYG